MHFGKWSQDVDSTFFKLHKWNMSHRLGSGELESHMVSPFYRVRERPSRGGAEWKIRNEYLINRIPEFMAKLFGESGTNWAALLWLKAGYVKRSGPTSPTFIFTFSRSTILLRTLKKHGFSCALCGLVWCPWMKQRGVSPSYFEGTLGLLVPFLTDVMNSWQEMI